MAWSKYRIMVLVLLFPLPTLKLLVAIINNISKSSATVRCIKDGWIAVASFRSHPLKIDQKTLDRYGPGSQWDPEQDRWELYHLETDYSQSKDLAAQHPKKLAELKNCFGKKPKKIK